MRHENKMLVAGTACETIEQFDAARRKTVVVRNWHLATDPQALPSDSKRPTSGGAL